MYGVLWVVLQGRFQSSLGCFELIRETRSLAMTCRRKVFKAFAAVQSFGCWPIQQLYQNHFVIFFAGPSCHNFNQAKDWMDSQSRSLVCQVSVTMLCINFFIATAFPQMLHVTGSVAAAEDLNSQFAAFLPAGGIVYIPLIGILRSQLKKAESRWNSASKL